LSKKNFYVCVYCGASDRADEIYKTNAVELGEKIATNGYSMVYGGGRLGMMGLISKAALAKNGEVIGFSTAFLDEREGAQEGLTELHIAHSMHERKNGMYEKADAFLVFPGGYGTLDEFFDVLTLKQIGQHQKPIIILNINKYWDPLIKLFDHIIDKDFAMPKHRQMISVANIVDDVFEILKKQ
jgi:uncharacterized protein (TIGR00730 family)